MFGYKDMKRTAFIEVRTTNKNFFIDYMDTLGSCPSQHRDGHFPENQFQLVKVASNNYNSIIK